MRGMTTRAPSSVHRGRPMTPPSPPTTTTTTTTTPADPSSGDPSRSLADVLGKRPTPASDPKSSASAKPPAKKAARAKPLSGPGITSFFGGGGKGGSGSDEDAPSRMPTRAEKFAADEAEEAAAIAAALAASEADEEDRRVKKAAAAEAAATAGRFRTGPIPRPRWCPPRRLRRRTRYWPERSRARA